MSAETSKGAGKPAPTGVEKCDVCQHPYHGDKTCQQPREAPDGRFGGCGCYGRDWYDSHGIEWQDRPL